MVCVKMKKTRCEVYSRVVGYIRPVQQWNDGKQAEFKDRKNFTITNDDKNKTKRTSKGKKSRTS
jgi:ribonucleoside-triphosphate reductase